MRNAWTTGVTHTAAPAITAPRLSACRRVVFWERELSNSLKVLSFSLSDRTVIGGGVLWAI